MVTYLLRYLLVGQYFAQWQKLTDFPWRWTMEDCLDKMLDYFYSGALNVAKHFSVQEHDWINRSVPAAAILLLLITQKLSRIILQTEELLYPAVQRCWWWCTILSFTFFYRDIAKEISCSIPSRVIYLSPCHSFILRLTEFLNAHAAPLHSCLVLNAAIIIKPHHHDHKHFPHTRSPPSASSASHYVLDYKQTTEWGDIVRSDDDLYLNA